jgi:hypothetical protein
MARSSDSVSAYAQGMEGQAMRDELIARLDEVDQIIREQIKKHTDRDGHASSRLSCLIRCRADIQSAITCLLGSSA